MASLRFWKFSKSLLKPQNVVSPLSQRCIFAANNPSLAKITRKLNGVQLVQEVIQKRFIRTCSQLQNNEKQDEDNIKEQITVYNGALSTQIRYVKVFSLSTSIMGIAVQPIFFNELSAMQNIPVLIAGLSFVGFFTFVTPLLLHYITKKYVICMDYNSAKGTYIATTLNFFCRQKKVEFKPDDVHVPDVPGMFTTFLAKGKPLFLEARLFENPTHYARIMGYDKPMDFKLFQTHANETEKKS